MTRRIIILFLIFSIQYGCKYTTSSPKIVGGTPVDDEKILKSVGQISFGYFPISENCTGVAISKQHILTAGHCVPDSSVYLISSQSFTAEKREQYVRVAKSSATVKFGKVANGYADGTTVHEIETFYAHPEWKILVTNIFKTYDEVNSGRPLSNDLIQYQKNFAAKKIPWHDLAIIKLKRPFDKINPMQLPTAPVSTKQQLSIAGYGIVDPKARTSPDILNTAPGRKVLKVFPEEGEFLLEGRGVPTACSGDSGGPAFDLNSHTVVGILSHATNEFLCRDNDNIYIDVYQHLKWINEVLHETL